MSEFQPKSGDKELLSSHDRDTLEGKVLPKARQWVAEYPERSPLWQHGKQTLAYWGE
jgi:hypothetical protein